MNNRFKPSKLEYFALALTFLIGVLHVCAQDRLAGVIDTNFKNAAIIMELQEENDCSVRAVSEAYDISYKDAWILLGSYGRARGDGMYFGEIRKCIDSQFPNTASELTTLWTTINSHTFVKDIAIAGYTYLILADRHVFVIEEGRHNQWLVKGNIDDAGKTILGYITIKNKDDNN